MTVFAKLTVVIAACCIGQTSSVPATGSPATGTLGDQPHVEKMLWVGSSSSYWNYMGKHVADWLTTESSRKTRYIAHLVWRNGTRIETYLETAPSGGPILGLDSGQTVLDRIRDGKYKYVALQIVTHFMSDPKWGPPQDKAIDVYVKAIRAAGAEPVFYEQGWRNDKTKTLDDHRKGQQSLFQAALRNHVNLVAPCATAWDLVRMEKPDLMLQEPSDRAHPGPLGNFLNCCVFYATLTGKEPRGMPRTLVAWDHHWSEGYKADIIPTQVQVAPAGDTWKHDPSWKAYIGPYPNHIRGYVGTIDDQTAAYLEQAAWRVCRDYRSRLNSAENPSQAGSLRHAMRFSERFEDSDSQMRP